MGPWRASRLTVCLPSAGQGPDWPMGLLEWVGSFGRRIGPRRIGLGVAAGWAAQATQAARTVPCRTAATGHTPLSPRPAHCRRALRAVRGVIPSGGGIQNFPSLWAGTGGGMQSWLSTKWGRRPGLANHHHARCSECSNPTLPEGQNSVVGAA